VIKFRSSVAATYLS